MKILKLVSKQINNPINNQPLDLNFKDMIRVALDGNQENLKGFSRITKVVKIWDKIENADGEIKFEDAEFDIVYESVDKCQWAPLALRFGEFFEEIETAKTRKAEI